MVAVQKKMRYYLNLIPLIYKIGFFERLFEETRLINNQNIFCFINDSTYN